MNTLALLDKRWGGCGRPAAAPSSTPSGDPIPAPCENCETLEGGAAAATAAAVPSSAPLGWSPAAGGLYRRLLDRRCGVAGPLTLPLPRPPLLLPPTPPPLTPLPPPEGPSTRV